MGIIFKNGSLLQLMTIFALVILPAAKAVAQISPPGLSHTRLASWMAIGLDQSFGNHKAWQSVSYLGYGWMSHPKGNYRIFEKPSMFIVNEEMKRKLSEHMSVTAALSYREQYLYKKDAPYHKADPAVRKELRVYGKLAYGWKTGKTKWNLDFRPEYRTFFLPAFEAGDTRNAVRARFKLKSTTALSGNREHFLILSAESLFQNERTEFQEQSDWSGFFYDDSRFCVYYRYAPEGWPLYAEIGYMNNLTEKHPTYSMHHIGLDIVFKDIF